MALIRDSRLRHTVVFLLVMISAGCSHEVSLSQLRQKDVDHRFETVNCWFYMGSEDGYHYIRQKHTLGSGTYRVAKSELAINHERPLTGDRRKWVPLPWGTTEACGNKADHDLVPADKNVTDDRVPR